MKWFVRITLVVAALFVVLGTLKAQTIEDPMIARGRYLVNQVAMCVQCHSPRDEKGALIESQLLYGAPIPVGSPYPNEIWAFQAPHIAGLPGYSVEDGVRLLTTGIAKSGQAPKRPMPPFRFSPEDAQAVVAYLKSLG